MTIVIQSGARAAEGAERRICGRPPNRAAAPASTADPSSPPHTRLAKRSSGRLLWMTERSGRGPVQGCRGQENPGEHEDAEEEQLPAGHHHRGQSEQDVDRRDRPDREEPNRLAALPPEEGREDDGA